MTAWIGQAFASEVAATFDSFIVLLDQDRADQPVMPARISAIIAV